jgi:uncharacterized iron-regulated protein
MWKQAPVLALILCLILGISYIFGIKDRQIIRIRDERIVSFETMMKDITPARTVFVGERHDSPAHHKTQLDVIEALYQKGKPLAIGIEMFKKKDQHILEDWISGNISEEDFIPIFFENWGYNWNLYRDIFLYAQEKSIPLIALNVPREITGKVAESGFDSLTDQELAKLPPGVTCELDEEYMDHLEWIFEYKKRSGRSFVYFCEAQVLWDQAMAWYLSEYVKSNPGRTVIVLAGAIHTWKYGIPKHSQRYISGEQRVIVPDLPVGPESISENDADYFVIHG